MSDLHGYPCLPLYVFPAISAATTVLKPASSMRTFGYHSSKSSYISSTKSKTERTTCTSLSLCISCAYFLNDDDFTLYAFVFLLCRDFCNAVLSDYERLLRNIGEHSGAQSDGQTIAQCHGQADLLGPCNVIGTFFQSPSLCFFHFAQD